MNELHTVPKHPLSGEDHESYFDLHMVPSEYQPKGEGSWHSITRLTPGGWGSLPLIGCPPRRRELIINPQAREDYQPWLATHLGERNSDFKPIVRGPC